MIAEAVVGAAILSALLVISRPLLRGILHRTGRRVPGEDFESFVRSSPRFYRVAGEVYRDERTGNHVDLEARTNG